MPNKSSKNLPEIFLNRLNEYFGNSFLNTFVHTANERPTTFRVNTLKSSAAAVREALRALAFKLQNVPWYQDAFILKNKTKRELMETSLYLEGKIYLQSLASMVPPLALNPEPGEKILDLTAAPGSKTSQIAALMNATGQLIANDNNKIRFFKLKHNLELLGVLEDRPAWEFELSLKHGVALVKKYQNYFDKILLDAPCSAEARFIAGDSTTYGYWSERKIREMAYKQRALLLSAWRALKPGGIMVYSTCTLAPEENEFQIVRLVERFKNVKIEKFYLPGLKTGPIFTGTKQRPLKKDVSNCLRVEPTKEIESFFVVKLRKTE
ncbi:MAG: RsmB/NOP family class I SAM-dependent RNA methyltransferase [Candidatus Magasanikbacteria bacterium]|nr:RsmB/NOP family class I SAM-dependent RNA methyltransferase [Candidatus Magasanikbacteria bacterium]